MNFSGSSFFTLLIVLTWSSYVSGNFPLLDVDTNMRIVLVPHDMPTHTAFYRIKATDSDHNFPLSFEVLGTVGKALLSIQFLGCSETESLCQADVMLNKPLDIGRTYEFQLRVTDTVGDFTRVKAAISATEGTAFQHYVLGPQILMIPEDTAVGTKLTEFVIVKNELNSRTVHLELREADERIELRQRLLPNNRTEGSLFLKKKLDFESEPWFTFKLLAMNGRTNISVDTRNVLISDVVIGVVDVQDTPPFFLSFPTYVEIPPNKQKGDLVARVSAEDGDMRHKRLIRYGLLTDSNPFIAFFDLDPMSGEIHLRKNISELYEVSRPNEHIHLSVMAEEIPSPTEAISSVNTTKDNSRTVKNITFRITRLASSSPLPPIFSSTKYIGEVEENALIGTFARFQLETKVWSLDAFNPQISLSLKDCVARDLLPKQNQKSPNPFELIPLHGYGNVTFELRVSNSELLDFEQTTVFKCKIQANSGSGLSSTSEVEIYVRDENDCKPIFNRKEYYAEIDENSPPGTSLVQVHATDCDTGNYGKLIYAQLSGSEAFQIQPLSGAISVLNPNLIDREVQSEIRFYVTATDGGGLKGDLNFSTTRNMGIAIVIVKLRDINDSPPIFQEKIYYAQLNSEFDGLQQPVQVKADDADMKGEPNAQIRYEVVGNSNFVVDPVTGDVRLKSRLEKPLAGEPPFSETVRVRAYDLGLPSLSSETTLEIHGEMISQEMQFLFPASEARIRKERVKVEEMLSSLLGGQVSIKYIAPYEPASSRSLKIQYLESETESNNENSSGVEMEKQRKWLTEKTLVTTTVQEPAAGKTRVFDLEALKSFMISEEPSSSTTEKNEPEIIKADSQSLFWLLIGLIILLLILFAIFVCCIFCPCCWLTRSSSRARTKSKSERVVTKRRDAETQLEVSDSRRMNEIQHGGGRTAIHTIMEDGEQYNLGVPHFPRVREAWSGDEREYRLERRRKVHPQQPPHTQLLPQRFPFETQDLLVEDWDVRGQRPSLTIPGHLQRAHAGRRHELVGRWAQGENSLKTHDAPYGRLRPREEGDFNQTYPLHRRNEEQDQLHYLQDRFSDRGNYGYHTNDRRVHRQYSPIRSPPHSLPPAPPTADNRFYSGRYPQPRFFKTDKGEVLQFDFEGRDDDGKEMIMRRFIDDQKPQRQSDFAYANQEMPNLPTIRTTDDNELRIERETREDQFQGTSQREAEDETFPHSKENDRPRAAAGSRRKVFPAQKISKVVEEHGHDVDQEVEGRRSRRRHHDDAESRQKKDKEKHSTRKNSRSKSDSKSKDRSRSRENEGPDLNPDGQEKVSRKRDKSKSPVPPQRVAEEKYTQPESNPKGHIINQSKSIQSVKNEDGLESTYLGISSSSPILIRKEIRMEEKIQGRHRLGKNESEELGVALGNLLIPDQLNDLLKEEDEDSGIGIMGMAQRSRMMEKKSIFTIAYDEMATQNVLRPDTAVNNES